MVPTTPLKMMGLNQVGVCIWVKLAVKDTYVTIIMHFLVIDINEDEIRLTSEMCDLQRKCFCFIGMNDL